MGCDTILLDKYFLPSRNQFFNFNCIGKEKKKNVSSNDHVFLTLRVPVLQKKNSKRNEKWQHGPRAPQPIFKFNLIKL